jgi:hypothetical protein
MRMTRSNSANGPAAPGMNRFQLSRVENNPYSVRVLFGVLASVLLLAAASAFAQVERTDDRPWYAKDFELGYSLVKEARVVKARKRVRDGALLYEAVYTIDKGIRVTPFGVQGPPVFFLGDSFTFGEGVADDETIPAQFAKYSNRLAYNFGGSGYGPHQILRMLEIRRPEEIAPGIKPLLVVYTLIPHHVERAAGRSPWDTTGPLYNVVNGKLEHCGPFNACKSDSDTPAGNIGSRIRKLIPSFGSTEEVDRIRVLEIIKKVREISQAAYGAPLLIVLWDRMPGLTRVDIGRADWLRKQLQELGIPTIVVSQLSPAPTGDSFFYPPDDNHPKARAYEVVGKAIAEFVRSH